jgi:formate dehydrogenase gamma subunit
VNGSYLRFTLAQRIQHVLLFTSFFLLMLTGLPLFFPESPIVREVFFFSSSFQLRGEFHPFAAVLLMLLCVYHVGYCLFTRRGHDDLREMLIHRRDLRDVVDLFLYNIGRREAPPRFGRFNFKEKFEYWAVVWGAAVMIVTGLMQWYVEVSMILFPKWVLDMSRIIHGYEAILAFLAIVIWHFYNVHLNPEVFPMSRVWIHGRISLEELKRHHPLEYERLVERGEILPEEPKAGADDGTAPPGTEPAAVLQDGRAP